MQHQYIQPALLLRQFWLLAAFAGIFATRQFWPAFICLCLLLLHQHQRILVLGVRSAVLFVAGLLLCFSLGSAYAHLRAAPLLPLPEWALEAAAFTPQQLELERELATRKTPPQTLWDIADNRKLDESSPDKEGVYRRGLRLRARVLESEGRVDRSLRLILGDIRPLGAETRAWPGKLAFTWYRALTPEGSRPLPPDTPKYLSREQDAPLLPARPVPGQELELTLRLRHVHGLKNPGLWDIEPYWADQGVSLRAWEQGANPNLQAEKGQGLSYMAMALRENWRQRVLAALPLADKDSGEDSGASYLANGSELIPALLFGDMYLMDSRDSELFARSTLTHSLSLSGLHLSYAAALGYFAVFVLYRLRPGLANILPRRKAAVIGGALPALFYLWLGGVPPPLLRSALMLAFVGWSLYRSRPLVLADSLIWALAVILLLDPLSIFDLRLQLSALCMAALAWGQPVFSLVYDKMRELSRGPAFVRRFLCGAVLLLLSSLLIQLSLAPLLIKTFGLFGLAMYLNVIWLPVLGFVVMPCAFIGLGFSILSLTSVAELFFSLASLPCGALLKLLHWMDSSGSLTALLPLRPHWLSMLGFWLILLLLPGFKARALGWQKLVLAFVLLLMPLVWPVPEGVRMRLLDVGQGQAVLLEQGKKRILIDGGGGSNPRFDVGREVVAATLTDNRLPRLNYMLASHLDMDHAAGLLFPLEHLRVGYYADNGESIKNEHGSRLLELLKKQGLERHVLRMGDVLELGDGLVLEVLHPDLPRSEEPSDGNRNSLVLRVVWQGRGLAVLCGDVDKVAQRLILRKLQERDIMAEVLVLAHHGAASALLPEFYEAVGPRLALSATGYGNFWNFPSPVVKNTLLEKNIPLLSTAVAGQIEIFWSEQKSQLRLGTARYGELSAERRIK